MGDNTVLADAPRVLIRSNVLSRDALEHAGVKSDDSLVLLYTSFSREIQEYIVLPYLRDKLK